ncbi:MAG: hypothetical protein GC199_04820 [Alphaproteobacteria bacterium]|nr:hypothetical protein [Alphaproteobacteria bacterium]
MGRAGAARARAVVVSALAAAIWTGSPGNAAACEYCGGLDFSTGYMLTWLAGNMHASLIESMNAANGALASGNVLGAATPLLLSASYGVAHTLGPGHGKLIIAADAFAGRLGAAAILWRAGLAGFVHVAGALALMLVLGAAVVAEGDSADVVAVLRLVSAGLVIAVGALLLVRALFAAASHGHAHTGAHGPLAAGATALAMGLVPCTGAALILAVAVGHGLALLGLASILAIGAGMAITLAAIGLLAGWSARGIGTRPHVPEGVYRTLAAIGGLFVIGIGALLLWAPGG